MSEVLPLEVGEQAQYHFGCVVKEMPHLRHPSNPQMHELTWVPGQLPPGTRVCSFHAEHCLCPAPRGVPVETAGGVAAVIDSISQMEKAEA